MTESAYVVRTSIYQCFVMQVSCKNHHSQPTTDVFRVSHAPILMGMAQSAPILGVFLYLYLHHWT